MEKITELETRQKQFERDYKHEVTIFKGVLGAQGIDIKEIKLDIQEANQRLESMQEDIDSIKGDIKQILALLKPEK